MVEAKKLAVSRIPKDLLEKYRSSGQEHVFKFVDDLDEDDFKAFLKQLEGIDLDYVLQGFKAIKKGDSDKKTPELKPIPDEMVWKSDASPKESWDLGIKAIKEGKVAVVTLAGGQGTRLGSTLPKGCFNIGLPSGMSLFQMQAWRLRRLIELATGLERKDKSVIPWFIMTSPATHQDTVNFFRKNDYFGLSSETITFFQQGELPALTDDGKLILKGKGMLAMSPNGNGGIYPALLQSGVLDAMKKKNIDWVHMYCVDNALVRIADPKFIGAAIIREADCSSKSIPKIDPTESVGVFCSKSTSDAAYKMTVAEYSELDSALAAKRNPSSSLIFSHANIANHLFSRSFLEKAVHRKLSLHLANKKIPSIDETTGEIREKPILGWKLETFIFDVLSLAERPLIFEGERRAEFAPLKNATGAALDSPEYCRRMVVGLHKEWLKDIGAKIEGDVEISPLVSYGGEGLEKLVQGCKAEELCGFVDGGKKG